MAWTQKEIEYLDENIGIKSIAKIAMDIRKNPKSVDVYRLRKGKPSCREAVDGISVTEFAAAVGRCTETIYDYISQKGLPIKRVGVGAKGKKEMFICQDKFWQWASKNKKFIDFSKIERFIFGPEPDWVKEQRKHDTKDWVKKGWERPWSDKEDALLLSMLKLYKHTFREISEVLKRSELAIQQRLYQTDIKLRPIAEEKKVWKSDEVDKLKDLYYDNQNIFTISRILGRSEIQVKTKVQRIGLRRRNSDAS